MQPEGAHPQNEGINQGARNPDTAIGRERLPQHLKVAEKLIHRGVGRQHLRQLVLSL